MDVIVVLVIVSLWCEAPRKAKCILTALLPQNFLG
jgi:hypothetical protein